MPLKILKDEPLILTPHPNGGWTIMQANLRQPGMRDNALGAYTTAQDMLRDLSETLMPDYVHSTGTVTGPALEVPDELAKSDYAKEKLLGELFPATHAAMPVGPAATWKPSPSELDIDLARVGWRNILLVPPVKFEGVIYQIRDDNAKTRRMKYRVATLDRPAVWSTIDGERLLGDPATWDAKEPITMATHWRTDHAKHEPFEYPK